MMIIGQTASLAASSPEPIVIAASLAAFAVV